MSMRKDKSEGMTTLQISLVAGVLIIITILTFIFSTEGYFEKVTEELATTSYNSDVKDVSDIGVINKQSGWKHE